MATCAASCLCRERASNRVKNFSLVSKHVNSSSSVHGEAWTLDETFIFQHLPRINYSIGIYPIITGYIKQNYNLFQWMDKDKVWSRCNSQRQDWDLGTGGFLLQQTFRRSDSKVLLYLLCRDPIPRREVFADVVPWEDANPLPASRALDWLKSPTHHLTPKSPMSRVPQGPTTTALPLALCNQSSNCQFLFQLLSVQRARAVLIVVFPSFLIYRLSNCIWSRQGEETNNIVEHLGTLIANYS